MQFNQDTNAVMAPLNNMDCMDDFNAFIEPLDFTPDNQSKFVQESFWTPADPYNLNLGIKRMPTELPDYRLANNETIDYFDLPLVRRSQTDQIRPLDLADSCFENDASLSVLEDEKTVGLNLQAL